MKNSFKENLKPVIFIAIVLVLAAISAYPQRKFAGRVVEVLDGRTCVIEVPGGKLTAVLLYIEVPEPEQPLHQTVKEHLESLVLDKKVEYIPRAVTMNRTFVRLFVKNVDVSQQMLRDGAAWHSIAEKDSQEENESLLYQDNETQAKAEKRGVWGVENLKPSWEFRAERADLRRKQEAEAARKSAFLKEMQSQNKKLSQPSKTVPQMEMWANIDGASQLDQPLGIGGLREGFSPSKNIGAIFTPSIYLDFPNDDFLKKVEARVYYAYRGSKTNIEDSFYFIGFLTTSKNFKFLKSSSITVTADGQKIVLSRVRRYYRQDAEKVSELVFGTVKRAQLLKIAKAEKISVRLGRYSGIISSDSLTYLNNLMDATSY
jgi:endonuclease YncB( thermonuclease family)